MDIGSCMEASIDAIPWWSKTILAGKEIVLNDISTIKEEAPYEYDNMSRLGIKAYVGLTGRVAQVTEIVDDDVISVANKHNEVRAWVSNICHATQENYEMLCKLYPHIEFELPHKEITGNDLCCLMLRNKHTNIMCQVDSDETNIRIITLYTGGYFYDRSGNRYSEVVPIDTKGIPLTEDVLNEIN